MSNEYTELEWELLHQSDYLLQNEHDLKDVLNSAQVTLRELARNPKPDTEVYDWAEFVLGNIAKIKRKVSFRRTMFRRRYPNS